MLYMLRSFDISDVSSIDLKKKKLFRESKHFDLFQCVNGHLMCASCFNHLLADCKLKDEQTTWYVRKEFK